MTTEGPQTTVEAAHGAEGGARTCDIVMKGGITSGIVYPAAVCEIAKSFVFKNVGGTLAGAIAAALTAAAERRRATDGAMDGFARLGAVPDWLSEEDRLYRLFVPSTATRSLYRTVVGLFGRPRWSSGSGGEWNVFTYAEKWCGLVWAFPVASLVGAVPGAAFVAALLAGPVAGWERLAGLLLAVLTGVAGVTLGVAVSLVRDLLTRLPENGYGLVKGLDDANPANPIALATWLTQELEVLAGLPPGQVPLTFGMLWNARRATSEPGLEHKPATPDVNLEMITTNVTWGRPYAFPTDRLFFFDPAEFRTYFPAHVVDWMIARARKPRSDAEAARFAHYAPKVALPLASDLPVIVATRMSLAFPVLLSAVPLYVADFSLTMEESAPILEQCWFTDGGISSNFPVTLFDAPLPRSPTFAINLAPFHPAHPQEADEAKNVYLPQSNNAGRLPSFSSFRSVPGFFSAIVNVMQNWNDNAQSILPGYRDRIVTVFLAPDEGGLNLDMPQAVLKRLKARGTAAGALIADRFRTPSPIGPGKNPQEMGWQNHRWLRFRTTLGALRTYLARFATAAGGPVPPDASYRDLVTATAGISVDHYSLPPVARESIAKLVDVLAEIGQELEAQPGLERNLPKPSPQLVLRPDLET